MLKSLFNIVAGLKTCNFIKKSPHHWCFSCDSLVNFTNTFFTAHLCWLLLYNEWMNFLFVYFYLLNLIAVLHNCMGCRSWKKLITFFATKYFFDAGSSCFCRHKILFCAISTFFLLTWNIFSCNIDTFLSTPNYFSCNIKFLFGTSFRERRQWGFVTLNGNLAVSGWVGLAYDR